MKGIIISIIASLLVFSACGGGGGGGEGDSGGSTETNTSDFLGVWRGTLFVVANDCPGEATDTIEGRYTVNSDAARTIVHESSTEVSHTFEGPPHSGNGVLTATQQQQYDCSGSGGGVLNSFRTVSFLPPISNTTTINRMQDLNGCGWSCSRLWVGEVTKTN
ncbi:hypothetical protein OAO01_05025 [Oligoflexia bacterium]|nr:hypothetical protein [Oligoflexia bacterium]